MNAIKSVELAQLIGGRAFIIALMDDPDVSPCAMKVGSLLWAITETWSMGEERTITHGQIAERIRWRKADGTVTCYSKGAVGVALRELAAAGYVTVKEARGGRNKPSTLAIIRRRVGDDFTMDERGSFRVWPSSMMPAKDEDGVQTAGQEGICTDTRIAKKVSAQTHVSEEGVCTDTPIAAKVSAQSAPYKGTSLEGDQGTEADLRGSLPPLAGASGPAPSGPAIAVVEADAEPHLGDGETEEQAETTGWADLTSASKITDYFVTAVAEPSRAEMTAQKRSEIEEGMATLLDTFPPSHALWGLGCWAGDRRLANANLMAEIGTRHILAWDLDQDALEQAGPAAVLEDGYTAGAEHRAVRLSKAS